ncbi:hypothetical protein CCS01_07685 [Rhodopila globiformis]|uniref:Uncharacterized protein n=1 Tax=Rhodopila globiformis TaxID=1071 RepID=A0A2S6NKA6_RHOGL|nr:hypothetical protein CCS01_07685 [Rhodopila globiformis]
MRVEGAHPVQRLMINVVEIQVAHGGARGIDRDRATASEVLVPNAVRLDVAGRGCGAHVHVIPLRAAANVPRCW